MESSESKLHLILEFCDSDLKKYMNNIRGTLNAKLVKVPYDVCGVYRGLRSMASHMRGICRS